MAAKNSCTSCPWRAMELALLRPSERRSKKLHCLAQRAGDNSCSRTSFQSNTNFSSSPSISIISKCFRKKCSCYVEKKPKAQKRAKRAKTPASGRRKNESVAAYDEGGGAAAAAAMSLLTSCLSSFFSCLSLVSCASSAQSFSWSSSSRARCARSETPRRDSKSWMATKQALCAGNGTQEGMHWHRQRSDEEGPCGAAVEPEPDRAWSKLVPCSCCSFLRAAAEVALEGEEEEEEECEEPDLPIMAAFMAARGDR